MFELGCQVERLPYTYLGLPLGTSFKLLAMWDVVEVTLIRSTLSNLSIYYMSLLVIPRRENLKLEKIQ